MERPNRTRVLVADEQDIFRAGLRAILDALATADIVGEAATRPHAVALARDTQPDVVLLDRALDDDVPGALVREIRAVSSPTAVILLATNADSAHVLAAVAAGASGYLLKTAPRGELADAIERTVAGDAFVDPLLAGRLVQTLSERAEDQLVDRRPEPLTPREREVLTGISRGRSNKEIATDLSMASGTVKIHVERILRKLSAANRVEAATIGLHHGLIRDEIGSHDATATSVARDN